MYKGQLVRGCPVMAAVVLHWGVRRCPGAMAPLHWHQLASQRVRAEVVLLTRPW